MIHLESDYMDSAHPELLKWMEQRCKEKNATYGEDEYCRRAAQKIKEACEDELLEVHFLVGGTQTNATVIDALLRTYEGVVAAESGHINVHEAGAIEAGGHKVLTLPSHDGKIDGKELEHYLYSFDADPNKAHCVRPGMVYISHPTEYGSLYSHDELMKLSDVCHRWQIPLYMDGARLSQALAVEPVPVSLPEIASACDIFYIGGTKNGILFGEAVVFKQGLIPHFFTHQKCHGALLAKGWLLGMQFEWLFSDDHYLVNAKNAIEKADRLRKALIEKGYSLYSDSPTNQVFVVMECQKVRQLQENVAFSVWEPYDESHMIVRFVTGWATENEEIDALIDWL